MPRVGYESRGVAEVEICGANPDFEQLSDLIAKWLWYWLSQVVVLCLLTCRPCRWVVQKIEEAEGVGALEQAKARERAKPVLYCSRFFIVGAAAWVAYEIVKANE